MQPITSKLHQNNFLVLGLYIANSADCDSGVEHCIAI